MEEKHGYYSNKQMSCAGAQTYLDKDGNEVIVTLVCGEKIKDDEVTKYFNDTVYKGIVTKYVSSLKINN